MVTWKWPWRKGQVKPQPPEVGDPTLVIAVAGDDEAVATSVAFGAAGFDDDGPVVERHLLRIPASQREDVTRRCVVDGYEVDQSVPSSDADDGLVLLAVARVAVVDAVSLSRTRSRMASVASRAGGRVEGWAVLRRGDTPVTASEG
ncbi:hypothetical protein [Gordonia phthalatica]|uniref:Uncharacterized protein n=1 Tax=Gordonia phthalatica TaxID=1136941 RepID=A0A0N9N384_9ACTN|nr:hypothetical protein [Gordonia phthalatica]ALG85178.1 hypothetical protein ACH46_12680 [Gordonia phthalatica]